MDNYIIHIELNYTFLLFVYLFSKCSYCILISLSKLQNIVNLFKNICKNIFQNFSKNKSFIQIFSININVNLFDSCQNILYLSLIGGFFHFYIHIAFPLFRRIRNTCQQWLQHGNTQQRLPVPTLSKREKVLLSPMVVALTFFTAWHDAQASC